jgi:Methyltransferase domain
VYTDEVEITRIETYGMTPKKIHEATRLSKFIRDKAIQHNIKKTLDIGSGQGYLSHLLVTRGSLNVVAIEAKEHNSHQSEKRGKIISEKIGNQGLFENVSLLVTQDNVSQFTNEPCILVGLHTCGDLSPICLKLFLCDDNIKGLINVGCCYHHLTEYIGPDANIKVEDYLTRVSESFQGRSIDETLFASESTAGFPLSNYIKTRYPAFFLGRLPRTLAISEPQVIHFKDPQLTFRKFQYRAAFQALLQEYFPEFALTFIIGNRIKKFDCFSNYAIEALLKMKIVHKFTDIDLNNFYNHKFLNLEKKSAIFWVLRSALSGCIENLIILDRALFLAENGTETEIRTVFDKLLSPRNVVISAFKY